MRLHRLSESHSASPAAEHLRSGGRPHLACEILPSSLHVAGGRRPFRAYCEVRAHIASGKLIAATPTAFHPRPSYLNVNAPGAAQTDRHVSGAKCMARAIEQPVCGRGILQLFHFTAGLERKPAFSSCWRAPGSIGESSEGYGCGRFGVRGCLRGSMSSALNSTPSLSDPRLPVVWEFGAS